MITAYEIAPWVPMAAPVTMFSFSAPENPVTIIPSEARETDTAIARSKPNIISFL